MGTFGDALDTMLAALGRLWIAGVKPDWEKFFDGEKRRRVPLPTYPFERERHWVEPAPAAMATNGLAVAADGVENGDINNPPPQLLVEQVIHEQLRLMTQQLEMLQG